MFLSPNSSKIASISSKLIAPFKVASSISAGVNFVLPLFSSNLPSIALIDFDASSNIFCGARNCTSC